MKMSEEEQWFAVFEILFPGHHPRPRSPYIDRDLSEQMCAFRDFLTGSGSQMLREHLASYGGISFGQGSAGSDIEILEESILAEGLGQICDQWMAQGLRLHTLLTSGEPGQDAQDNFAALSAYLTCEPSSSGSTRNQGESSAQSLLSWEAVNISSDPFVPLTGEDPNSGPPGILSEAIMEEWWVAPIDTVAHVIPSSPAYLAGQRLKGKEARRKGP